MEYEGRVSLFWAATVFEDPRVFVIQGLGRRRGRVEEESLAGDADGRRWPGLFV